MELKKIRLQKNLTQQAVADGIQVSPTVYARYERGEREPSIEVLIRMSAFFDVSVDHIIGNPNRTSSDLVLSKYEEKLLGASRNADDRARQDALYMLLSHQGSATPMGNELLA